MRSALTMLGIIIGVAAVLAMLAIGDGASKWTQYDGVNSHFPVGMKWYIKHGRFFSEDEFNNRRKVCLLGLEVATELFEDQNPVGKEIKPSKNYNHMAKT